MERKLKDLEETIRSTMLDNKGMKAEIDEKDETIVEKEKQSYELKKRNQELEKEKFVFDYQIKDLKKQIEPRDAEVKTALSCRAAASVRRPSPSAASPSAPVG